MALDVITTGWRTVPVQYGDTLQKIAYRELQDASRWPEVAWLNGLVPPYLTGDANHPGIALGTVILFGGSIRIPASTSLTKAVSQIEAFGIDILLQDGRIESDTFGDIQLISGAHNLRQALEMRLNNPLGSLPFHPEYGNNAHELRGQKNNGATRLLAQRFVEEALVEDPRIASVQDGTSEQIGDVLYVMVTAVADDETPLRMQVTI